MDGNAHLALPPTGAFWLNELRLADFDEVMAMLADPEALRSAVRAEFSGPGPRKALDQLLERGDTDIVHAHLLLLARFLRQKKTCAVTDVALAVFDESTLAEWRSSKGRLHRLPTAIALYAADPLHLLDVEVCHRWHGRRRCALELEGPLRVLPSLAGAMDWRAVAAKAQEHLEDTIPKLRSVLTFRRITFRRERNEVLLAWSAPADRDTVRHPAGHVVAGHHDDWTILRVHESGNRVDVTSSSLATGRALADGMARAVWGKGQYRVAHNRLTSESLTDLLKRMRSPTDDTFRLLEITAEVPGLPHRPIITVGNSGQARVEATVEELRRHVSYAERWNTVHRVKLAFGDAYRIEVHFPTPDEDLVLAYSDADRDKEVATAFERLVRDEIGVDIHPRTPRARRTRKESTAPAKPGSTTWARLLGGVLDEPAGWEREYLTDLAQRGVVTLSEHAWFRCGDGPVLPGRPDTLDCAGEIEMPYGEADPSDPFRQEDDAECVCGTCGTVWYPGRYRLPTRRRMRVTVHMAGAWKYVLDRLGELGSVFEEAPGVASVIVRGQRTQTVFLPLAASDPWHRSDLAVMAPTAWISVAGDDRLHGFGERGLSLADVVADGRGAIGRVFDLGRAGSLVPGAAWMAAAPPASPWGTPPAAAPVGSAGSPTTRFVSLDAKGVWLDRTLVVAAKATGAALLLALLDHFARKDEAAPGGGRRFRTAEQLARGVSGGTFTYSDVQTWVSRARKALREKLPGEPGLDLAVIEGGEGDGYRLGVGFRCEGFDLTDALTNRQKRSDR